MKNGKRICGTGAALANAPIVQNKAYFEVKLQSTGMYIFSCFLKLLFLYVKEIFCEDNTILWISKLCLGVSVR